MIFRGSVSVSFVILAVTVVSVARADSDAGSPDGAFLPDAVATSTDAGGGDDSEAGISLIDAGADDVEEPLSDAGDGANINDVPTGAEATDASAIDGSLGDGGVGDSGPAAVDAAAAPPSPNDLDLPGEDCSYATHPSTGSLFLVPWFVALGIALWRRRARHF
jgi:hypothetical protein